MKQIRRRPRAIAIARADESRQQKAAITRLALIAFFTVAALAALPALWF